MPYQQVCTLDEVRANQNRKVRTPCSTTAASALFFVTGKSFNACIVLSHRCSSSPSIRMSRARFCTASSFLIDWQAACDLLWGCVQVVDVGGKKVLVAEADGEVRALAFRHAWRALLDTRPGGRVRRCMQSPTSART